MSVGTVAVAYLASSAGESSFPWLVGAFFAVFLVVLVVSPETQLARSTRGAAPTAAGASTGWQPGRDAAAPAGARSRRNRRARLARPDRGASARHARLEQGRCGRRRLGRFAAAFAVLVTAAAGAAHLAAYRGRRRGRRRPRACARRDRRGARRLQPRHSRGRERTGSLLGDLGHRLHLSWASATGGSTGSCSSSCALARARLDRHAPADGVRPSTRCSSRLRSLCSSTTRPSTRSGSARSDAWLSTGGRQ